MINLRRELLDIQATHVPLPDSGCESRYTLHEGLLVIPVLGNPGDPPVVVRVHSPYTTRTSAFSYTKGVAPPAIPSPGNTRTGHIFLGGTLAIPAPGTSGEGSLVFRAAGQYNFVLPQHSTVEGKIMFDAHPYATGVDMLQREYVQNPDPTGGMDSALGGYYNGWTSQYFDLDRLSSYRILG